ncbi:hypothetical protein A2335_02510 [Candidatus Peregrinibacteria bacterium RIFOXYB2_FULL_32_7]|nr:MAG: hypothetical protein A2335_02510 [Candidatus Peregrinibacteria bacterium RIFOXYB2_FULL_32_7]
MSNFINNPGVTEPFSSKRAISRLLFDFSIMLSCIKEHDNNKNILDFACGTGWVAEFLNRSGFTVYGFDLSPNAIELAKLRVKADQRLDPEKLSFFDCDGHALTSMKNNFFSNVVCFDSLHHMKNFDKVISEISRILIPGGRAIFVEPGAKHSTSKETIEFMEKYKSQDPTWIERDIIIEDINEIGSKNGFEEMKLKPFLDPSMINYNLKDWLHFRNNKLAQEQLIEQLCSFNYDSRVIFYLDKKTSI